MSKKDAIKVPHPEHGHVIFSNTTDRQKDILTGYIKFYNRFNGHFHTSTKHNIAAR
jgi:hypothetical protein